MPTDLTQLGIGAVIVLLLLDKVFSFIRPLIKHQTFAERRDAKDRELELRDIDILAKNMEGWFKQIIEGLKEIKDELKQLRLEEAHGRE